MALTKNDVSVFFSILRDNCLYYKFFDLLGDRLYQSYWLRVIDSDGIWGYEYNDSHLPYVLRLVTDNNGKNWTFIQQLK